MAKTESDDKDHLSSMRDDGLFTGSVTVGISKLRNKLLDLSPRNRLLNYRHPKSSSVRVIDELPDIIFRKFVDGKSLDFRAVQRRSEKEETARQIEYQRKFGPEAVAP